jgi:Homeodomain-like domain
MAGKSPMKASAEQRAALEVLAASRERGEADRARAVLLTLNGWTSGRIAEAFGVREDTVRLWRSDFMRGGVEALEAAVAPGPPRLKSEAALRVVAPLLEAPVAGVRPGKLRVADALGGIGHLLDPQIAGIGEHRIRIVVRSPAAQLRKRVGEPGHPVHVIEQLRDPRSWAASHRVCGRAFPPLAA